MKKTTSDDIRSMVEEGRERMRDDYEQISKRLALALDFKHYRQGDEDDPRRILPKDPGIFRVLRYKASLLSKRFPTNVRCRPEDDSFGSLAEQGCEDMQHAIEDWISRPRNFYKYTRREVVWGALVAGVWYARCDYDPKTRDASISSRDPRWIVLPEGFRNPHDPRCPWVIDIDRVPTAIARKTPNWKGAAKLKPDDGYDLIGTAPDQSRMHPGQVNLLEDVDSRAWRSTEKTTIVRCYYRESYEKKSAADRLRPLGEGLEHMACATCGWKSPPQAEMDRLLNPFEVCPECGGEAELQMFHLTDVSAYPDGRMVLCAPFQPDLESLYDDGWPCQWPSFPFMFYGSYTHPGRYLPQSDASIHKSGALASNALVRLTYEQALQSKPHFKIPRNGLTNSRRQPFTFSPDDGNVMFDESMGGIAAQVQHFPASPMNTSIFALYDRLQGRFKEGDGTSDIAVAPGDSKDIPVGTIKALTATGNVPLDEHGELLYDAESFLLGALGETLRVKAANGMTTRYVKNDGSTGFKRIVGAYLPRAEVVVSAGPSLDDMDAKQLESYEKLVRTPPPYRRGLARFGRVSQEVLQQLAEDDAEAMKQGIPLPWAPAMPPPNAGGVVPPDATGVLPNG